MSHSRNSAEPSARPPGQADVFHDLRRRNERRARLAEARRERASNRERMIELQRQRRFPKAG